jgi:hypothetical protein
MPSAYVKKLAEKHGVSTDLAEERWNAAKKAAQAEGQGDNYAYVTSIFQNMMGETSMVLSRVLSRLKETAVAAASFEQQIKNYRGSEQSKAFAMRFCKEFESDLEKLGFVYESFNNGIQTPYWSSKDTDKITEVQDLFTKAGFQFKPIKVGGIMTFKANAVSNVPRFGGLTSISLVVYSRGVSSLGVSFSFFGY